MRAKCATLETEIERRVDEIVKLEAFLAEAMSVVERLEHVRDAPSEPSPPPASRRLPERAAGANTWLHSGSLRTAIYLSAPGPPAAGEIRLNRRRRPAPRRVF